MLIKKTTWVAKYVYFYIIKWVNNATNIEIILFYYLHKKIINSCFISRLEMRKLHHNVNFTHQLPINKEEECSNPTNLSALSITLLDRQKIAPGHGRRNLCATHTS